MEGVSPQFHDEDPSDVGFGSSGRSQGLVLRDQSGDANIPSAQCTKGASKSDRRGRFRIYEEKNGRENQGDGIDQFKQAKELAFLWPFLPAEREREKENQRDPSKWCGIKVVLAVSSPVMVDSFHFADPSKQRIYFKNGKQKFLYHF